MRLLALSVGKTELHLSRGLHGGLPGRVGGSRLLGAGRHGPYHSGMAPGAARTDPVAVFILSMSALGIIFGALLVAMWWPLPPGSRWPLFLMGLGAYGLFYARRRRIIPGSN